MAENISKDLKKYKALVKASNIGAWEYSVAEDFLWCNEIYFSMLGRNKVDYSVQTKNLDDAWADLLHPDDKEKASKTFAEYVKNPVGQYENYFRMSHADGSWIWIWSRGRLLDGLENTNSKIIIIGTHVDITKHKETEEVILQERILLRTLIDSLPDIIFVKDAEGRKVIANRADVSNMRAGTEADVIGKTDIELYPNEIGLRGFEDDMSVLKDGISILN